MSRSLVGLSLSAALSLCLSSCGGPAQADATEGVCHDASDWAPLEEAPAPSPRFGDGGLAWTVAEGLESWFAGHERRRLAVQLDRPLVRPGESVWVQAWDLATPSLTAEGAAQGVRLELVDPRGAAVVSKDYKHDGGAVTGELAVPADAPGGAWTLRATTTTGEQLERVFIVDRYSAPRVRKTLEFAREAYGPGDRVNAVVELARAAGGPVADAPVEAIVQVDGETILREQLRTDADGAVLISAALPEVLHQGDGLLTLLVDAGGVTESISRSIPMVVSGLDLRLFPEGGDLVSALPGRVYLQATNRAGEPADVAGRIEDDQGAVVARFRSLHDGLGRFEFTPEPGRSYVAVVEEPAGIDAPVPLPPARADGCVLRHYDDVDGAVGALRVGVTCAAPQPLVVVGSVRDEVLDSAVVEAGPEAPAVVWLEGEPAVAAKQGVARVTVLDADLEPLAERLVYRNPARGLQVTVEADQDRYQPRDAVTLTVKTTTPEGEPVPARVALSVVDDAVLKHADDERGHLLSRVYLEADLHEPLHDPAWYFDEDEEHARMGLDLVMGTKGWRRFAWKQVWADDPGPISEAELPPWEALADARDARAWSPSTAWRYRFADGRAATAADWHNWRSYQQIATASRRHPGGLHGLLGAKGVQQGVGGLGARGVGVGGGGMAQGVGDLAVLGGADGFGRGAKREEGRVGRNRAERGAGKAAEIPPARDLAAMPADEAAAPPPPEAATGAEIAQAESAEPEQEARRTRGEGKEDRRVAKRRRRQAAQPDASVAAAPMARPMPMEEAERAVAPMVADDRQAVAALGYLMADLDANVPAAPRAGMARGAQAQRKAEPVPVRRSRVAQWAKVREFPVPAAAPRASAVRTDFRDTVLWRPAVETGEDGTATVTFPLSDALTTFRAVAEGLGAGLAGRAELELPSVLPFSVDTRLPDALSYGDRLLLPVSLTSTIDAPLPVDLGVSAAGAASLGDLPGALTLEPGQDRTVFVPLLAEDATGEVALSLTASAAGLSDGVERRFAVTPRGFPRAWSASGELDGDVSHTVTLGEVMEGTLVAELDLHPGPLATLMDGLDGLVRTPGGCFEQTSSTNYPNVLVLDYLRTHRVQPRLQVNREQVLKAGYTRLAGYQVGSGGFETWGTGPGKEALSAYGLRQFSQMRRVFDGVGEGLLERNRRYLMSQRDGDGGFRKTGHSVHGYGSAPSEVLDSYITWALVTTGSEGLSAELAQARRRAKGSDDPYVLALSTATLAHRGASGARPAADRLAAMQADDGSFPGARSSIMRSGGSNLLVETTALATMALLKAGGHDAAVREAARWLQGRRQGAGTWGSTQATVLALEALTEVARASSRARSAGAVVVYIDGERAGEARWAAGQRDTVTVEGLAAHLVGAGQHTVTLDFEGREPLPYTLDLRWRARTPASSAEAPLALTTTLSAEQAALGETVRLHAQLKNETGETVPSPIARIGLPAGLEAQVWQLEELKKRGEIAFFETRPREVTLYWDGQHPDEVHAVDLDLVASLPGSFSGPASSAYAYYDDTHKAWAPELVVAVEP